jgi:HK97 gp10 family phage protein
MPQYIGDSAMENRSYLRDSIAIVSGVAGWGVLTLRVGPSKQHYQKALAQEYGTATQAAAPFIRPALDHNKTQVLRILAANIRYGIENR